MAATILACNFNHVLIPEILHYKSLVQLYTSI
jgi:hypothetical protein